MHRLRTTLAALGLSLVASALTATSAASAAAEPGVGLSVWGGGLLNETGDGPWESVEVTVSTDARAVHWELRPATSQEVLAQGDVTLAPSGGTVFGITVDSSHIGRRLTAGTYRLTVTGTAPTRAPTSRDATIHVSTQGPLRPLVPSASIFYPDDRYDGVAHDVVARVVADPTVLAHGNLSWEVVGPGGTVAGPFPVEPTDPVARWQVGRAPEGVYRLRLRVGDWILDRTLSAPVTLSRRYRQLIETTILRPAAATRSATATQRHARVRAVGGSLRYRTATTDWRKRPLVRTSHRLRLPSDRYAGQPIQLVVNGRWASEFDADLEIETRSGPVRNIDVYMGKDRRRMVHPLRASAMRADGTVRFRVLWSGLAPRRGASATGRTDTIGLRYHRVVWRR